IILEPKILSVDIDVSHEHIILINNSQDFLKYQHNIMDNRCISFFWPCDQNGVIGSRISITTEKEKTFVIDLDKIDIGLMNALLKNPRPIKVFYDAKPIIIWCIKNNLKISHIFDITTALNILSDGLTIDNSLKSIIKRFANQDINSEDISFQDFVSIGKFIFLLRKKLVDCIQELNLIKILNFEQNLLYAIAQSESDGMPYNGNCSKPMSKNVWELVESKYGITSKKELAGAGILFLNKAYLTDKKNLLEVYEYASLESAERTIKNFDSKFVREERIYSSLNYGPSGGIMTKDYSFDGEGLYPFISPDKDSCLVEGKYKNLEVRVVAKLLNNRKLIASFSAEGGPFSYFAGPLFDKAPEDITIDEKFKTKMIFEIVIRNLGERETLYYAWNTSKSFLAEEEIISLKEKFKKVHPDLTRLIKDTQKQAEKDGYVASSLGRVTILNNKSKAFFTKVEMYMHEIFKKALSLSFDDFEAYNTDFTNKIRLCTIYDHIITLECNKKIVNIAIDMLTRNMTTTAAKMLMGIPVLLKVNAVEQWEA
ncbi:MAG: DNA polymerase, partial [Deltaproteobacteria bacterium]